MTLTEKSRKESIVKSRWVGGIRNQILTAIGLLSCWKTSRVLNRWWNRTFLIQKFIWLRYGHFLTFAISQPNGKNWKNSRKWPWISHMAGNHKNNCRKVSKLVMAHWWLSCFTDRKSSPGHNQPCMRPLNQGHIYITMRNVLTVCRGKGTIVPTQVTIDLA